ncbi:MAG TPA: serine--tRNA ligase [Candidatus Nanoarchaeia archaeon]|nr:serine--tRNA ligase [Candidatus Nanoarchaeia archaeon]
MLDIKLIRENSEIVRENIKKKDQLQKLPLVDEILRIDQEWRKLKGQTDDLRASRNKVSKEISDFKKAGKDTSSLMKQASEIPNKILETEAKMLELEEKINTILRQLPNIISPQTPKGKDGSENKEIKKGGKIRKFDFPVKNHVEILESLNLVDFDASARAAGNGFYYLKGDLALLNQALIQFAISKITKKGYTYVEPPLMLHEKEIFASMDKNAIEQSVYKIKDEDLNLIGTSEQSVLAMHANQTINEWDLPKKYVSYSMCFRKEVGAHGINEKGLWRTHQFNKVEQFVFSTPEQSIKIYDELLKNSEEILDELEIPYRVIEICTGDLADWKYRSADLEVWRPTTKEYGEVMSLSNCTDYQARKLNIKCLDRQGNKRVLHTLNDTAIATSRIMVAIIENNQNEDGTVNVPKVLVPFMHGIKVIGQKKEESKKTESKTEKKTVKKAKK